MLSEERVARSEAAWDALCRSQAVIEFDLDGVILWANEVFLDIMGFTLAEVRGRHHRMFCSAELAASDDYADFWRKMRAGQFDGGQYKRVRRDGRDVWLQATYNPILDPQGRPVKVVKFATDVTAMKLMQVMKSL